MKRLFAAIVSVCLILSAVGCGSVDTVTTDPTETQTDPVIGTEANTEPTEITQVTQIPMASVSVPAVTESQTAEDGTVIFQYTYQTMALVLPNPNAADKVIIDFLNRVDKTRPAAEAIAQMAEDDYREQTNWIPYLYHLTYSPMRIDHKVLSLFGNNASYSGSNHPERGCLSASYDLATGDVLTLGSIMDPNATTSDFCQLVLDGLTEMNRENYLYDGYEDVVQQRFQTDESQDQDWYFSQGGLCFYFEPYEIAPYTAGVITVEIPYEKLNGLIYHDYLPEARNAANGAVTILPFESVDLSQFTQISEVIQSNEGSMHFLYTDRAVQDIRILVSDAASSYTIFAAYALTPGDAVMVQANDDVLKAMKVTFKAGGETHTESLVSQ